ncbi:MAG: hypothetical protein ACRD0K_05910 [Egibacteraceae bacterium]
MGEGPGRNDVSARSDEIDTDELEQQRAPRAAGRRAQRLAARRRALKRRRWLLLGAVGLLILVFSMCGRGGPTSASGDLQTLLLISHPPRAGAPASSVTLLAAGPQGSASVLFLPVGTLIELPGRGLDRLAMAYRHGGAPMVETAVENLLGIEIDHTSALSDPGLPGLLGRTGGLQIDLPQPLVEQPVDELTTVARQELVFRTLLSALKDRRARAATLAESAPQLGADADWLGELFAQLADAAADGRVAYTLLPVKAPSGQGLSTGGLYQVDEVALSAMVRRSLR